MRLYEFGRFRLDPERLLLYHGDVPMALGPKVVETLLALVEHPNEVLSKRALLTRVWPEGYVDEANLIQNVYVLRKLLRAYGHEGAIETLPRRGYRFILPVRAPAGERDVPRRSWRRTSAAAAVAAVLLVAAASAYGASRESRQRQIAMPSIESRLYTIGDFFLDRRTEYSVNRSILYFSHAIALQPRDAAAYAARADAYAVAADNRFGPVAQLRNRARTDALEALAIDPHQGRAYAALGLLAVDASRFSESLRDLRKAVSFAATDSDAHVWYGIALLSRGRVAEAENEMQVAERLDPLSIAAMSWISSVSYLDRRYGKAAAYAREGLNMAPQRASLWITLGLAQEAQGRYGSALASFERYGRSCGECASEAAALLARAYMQLHYPAQARAELAIAREDLGAVRPEDLMLAVAATGQHGLLPAHLRMTPVERLLVANDPRFERLPAGERLKLLDQD
jgi:DNA-binding winged helix-turn-helix (wHTH) protein/Flp pilus assembly protein TadD